MHGRVGVLALALMTCAAPKAPGPAAQPAKPSAQPPVAPARETPAAEKKPSLTREQANALVDSGWRALQQESYAEALTALERSLEGEVNNPDWVRGLVATAMAGLGRDADAERVLEDLVANAMRLKKASLRDADEVGSAHVRTWRAATARRELGPFKHPTADLAAYRARAEALLWAPKGPPQPHLAGRMLREACDAKDSPSCVQLGLALERNAYAFVEEMRAADAVSLYLLACTSGDAHGCARLGLAMAERKSFPHRGGYRAAVQAIDTA